MQLIIRIHRQIINRVVVALPTKQTFTQKENDNPAKQTFTYTAVFDNSRKQEKPAPEITPGRVVLYSEMQKSLEIKAFRHRKKVADFFKVCCLIWQVR